MNEFYYSLAHAIDNSFKIALVPISDPFNWACVVIAIFGIFVWLKMQSDFNKRAKKNHEIM